MIAAVLSCLFCALSSTKAESRIFAPLGFYVLTVGVVAPMVPMVAVEIVVRWTGERKTSVISLRKEGEHDPIL
ncbi:MAG: hypothetical protein ACREQF_07985 [Candidatus Binataceae bacterium]